MKNIFKIASAFLLLAWSSIALQGQTNSTNETWDSTKKKAALEHKLIFVDLYFTACAPCAQMDAEVFPDAKVSSLLNTNFIVFKSDILKEEIGKQLSMKYGVTGFPTFLLMNADGRIIEIVSGFHNVGELTAVLESAIANAKKGVFKKYSTKEETYPEFYSDAYLKNKRNVPFDIIDAYLKSQPSLLSEVPFVIISGLGVGGEYDDFFLKNMNTLAKDYGKASVNSRVVKILQRKKKKFETENDLESFKKLLAEAKPLYSTEEWTRYETYLLKDFGAVAKAVN